MRKAHALLLAVLLLGAAAVWALWPSPADPAAGKIQTRVVKVQRGPLCVSVLATGEIQPLREVELKSKASGRVVQFRKELGDSVTEGELIAELDKKVEQRHLTLSESALASAEAALDLTRLEHLRSLRQAESEAAAARADADQKKADLDRLEQLTQQLVAESDLGGARLAARLAEEKSRQAEASLALIRDRKEADEKLAGAEVRKAQVAVEDARERLQDTEIRAPFTGLLLWKLVEEGQIVASGISASTGGTPIAHVADVSRLWVRAHVDETDILKVRRGQKAQVVLLSGGGEPFSGQVDLIPPKGELDSNVTVFPVRVALEGHLFGRAYVGMTVSVSILVAREQEALLVPSEAIRQENGRSVVYVPNGTSPPRPVAIRVLDRDGVPLDNGEQAAITGGLKEGDDVYVTHTRPPGLQPNRAGHGGGRY